MTNQVQTNQAINHHVVEMRELAVVDLPQRALFMNTPSDNFGYQVCLFHLFWLIVLAFFITIRTFVNKPPVLHKI